MASEKRSLINLKVIKRIGLFLVALSFGLIVSILYPAVVAEIKYLIFPPEVEKKPVLEGSKEDRAIIVADKQFSIVIPKIGVNARVIEGVDPLNSREYQVALSQGIAHAKGSALPGEGKNTFLFAHSSDSFLNANRYNSVFYLLSKMDSDDKFYVVFNEKIYTYSVVEKKTIPSEDMRLLEPDYGEDTVVLMTCWPAGTTLNRLVAIGKLTD